MDFERAGGERKQKNIHGSYVQFIMKGRLQNEENIKYNYGTPVIS